MEQQEHRTIQMLQEAERETRKQLILTAALTLFGEKQISKVGMRDIAGEAGISPALIYRHFEDQDELFIEAFVKKSKEMIANFETTLSSQQIVSIEKIAKEFIHYLLNHPYFFRMMTYFMLDHTLTEKHLDQFNMAIRELLSIFDSGFELSGLKKDVRLHSHALLSALNGVMITFHHYPGRSEDETEAHINKIVALIASLFVNA